MTQNAGTWGASRIHGELKMLGYDISERSVLRGMREVPRSPEPAKGWMAFLSNQCEAIAAMDFFTALGGAQVCVLSIGTLLAPTLEVSHQLRSTMSDKAVSRCLYLTGGPTERSSFEWDQSN